MGVVERGGAEARAEARRRDERLHRGKEHVVGKTGIGLARRLPEAPVGGVQEVALGDAQLRRQGEDGVGAALDLGEEAERRLVEDDERPRGVVEAPRRPPLLVAEARPVAEGVEEGEDGARVVDAALQLEPRLDAPSRTTPAP